jgi:ABC-type sugar transport system permease subunit
VTTLERLDEMTTEKPSYAGVLHAGAGTALLMVQLGAIVPGFLPALAITIVLVALVVVPLLLIGLVLAVLAGPPVTAWWLWSRHRNRREADLALRATTSSPLPTLEA